MQTEHLSHGIQYLTKDIILKAWVEIKDSITLYIYYVLRFVFYWNIWEILWGMIINL
jgi:hypothetical protein